MATLFSVGAGGCIGAVARYALGLVPVGGDFPLMTFLVNLIGAVAIGAVVGLAEARPGLPENLLLFLKTGLCGGFTTFSTFSLETLSLFEEGHYGVGALYAGGSLVVCVLGVMVGRMAARAAMAALQA